MKRDIGSESRFLHTAPEFDHFRRPREGGFRRNIAKPFDVEKLDWFGYSMVKELKIYLFVLTDCTNVTDGHRHRVTALRPRLHSIAQQKLR